MIFANTKSRIGGKVLTAALLVLFFAASSAVVTSAADIYVPAGGNQNIQQAVNNASTGDTIIVRDGTYNENVYVNVTDLIIRSENGSGNCIVNAKYENTDVFFVTANYVTITGFTVQGATEFGYAGICLFGAGYCYISDNNVRNNGDGISILDSGYNLVANNIVTGNNYTGIYMELANANIVLGNTATNNGWEGIFIASSYNNTFIRNNASNNTIYEFYSDEYSQNNTVKDLQLCNNQTLVSFTYGNGAGLKCVDTVPTEPSEKRDISKYVETIEVCADSWLFLNMSYEEADLGCVAEDSLSMWEHSGTDWVEVAGTTGVNTAENYVYANITEFNIVAPLGDTNGVSLEPLGSSNGLNCTFGDLCVNATGWWPDNGTFNASGTPIQHAIDNASDSDTIIVHPGTYIGSVTFNNTDNLTLRSNDGPEVTTINFTGTECGYWHSQEGCIDIHYGTSGVTVEGFTIMGNSSASDALVSVGGDNNNINNNTVIGDSSSSGQDVGIHVAGQTDQQFPSGNKILNNEVYNHAGDGIFVGNWAGTDNIISGNVVHDNVVGGIPGLNGNGIEIDRAYSTTVKNNTVYNNDAAGIKVRTCSNMTVEACYNDIASNGVGIKVENKTGTENISLSVHCNNIHNNTKYGVNNTISAIVVDATLNWWSDKSGPGPVGSGSGDNVSANVSYDPWLAMEFHYCPECGGDPPKPNVTSYAPESPVNDTICTWRTFNVSVNQTVNVSWYLNNSLLHTNVSTKEANYTLHAEYVGEHNVSAVAENVNGTDMETWVWNVTAAPTYNCTCGDICVNTSGWWRNNGTFNANATMPIQAAVDNATAGETIYVYNGSYTENVNVNKQLTLEGEGAGVVTVTANSASDHVFEVTANYVNISGFSVTAAGSNMAGIYLSGGQHCNISDNTVSGNNRGIYLHSSCNYNTLTSNTVNSNFRGIQLYSSSNNNTLTNNTANFNSNCGIFVHTSSNNTLTSNTASNNTDSGIYLEYSSNNTLSNNTASNNTDSGIYLEYSGNNTLTSNTASNNTDSGIYLEYLGNNTLSNNTADSNSYYGIVLDDSSNYNTLSSNTASNNTDSGIYLEYSSNNTLSNNTVKLNYNGIYLWNADNNNITCNWVHGNTRAGFNLTEGSTGNNISCNNIVANGVYNGSSGGWEWQFYNDQTQEVESKNNYWGAGMDNKTINASIYDWQDDPANCGNVTYNPFEKDPNICAPIPELSTVVLLGVGLLMLAGYLRIRRKM